MTRHLKTLIGASATSALVLSTMAADNPNVQTDASGRPDRVPYAQRAGRLNDVAKASDIIGMTVKNYQDQKLGEVSDIAVDIPSGRVTQVILSTGGFLGMGDTLRAVPPGALQHDVNQKVLRLDVDKEKLKNAPNFDTSKWGEYSDSDHLGNVYRYYGEAPAFVFVQTGVNSPTTVATRKPDGTWEKDRVLNNSRGMIPSSRLGEMQRASKVIGTVVKDQANDRIGKVENLMIDLPSGRIVTVVLSSGGFLGMGDELSAVPPSSLHFNGDRDVLQIDASKETLSRAPHFKSSEWPNFAKADYTGSVYTAYQSQPYFSTSVDDTARNVRDRDSNTLTPMDQKEDKGDIDLTARIRREIMHEKDFTVDAKNVKIITVNGRVTLRGPVNTLDEKSRIGDIAERDAGAGHVDNRLEVKIAANNN
jgi:sporulation protein YlmC with PRC-barrel domain